MRGCDVAWGVVPGREREFARALKRRGFGFIVRYLCTDPSKRLTRAEGRAYKAEGLHIVTVYEDAADALLGGEPVGHAQAVASKQQLAGVGAPAHAPVYFAADFPATSGQIPAVDQALDGTALVLTEDLNGIYGEYALTSGAKHVRYRWQTTAWSAGRWSLDDEIRQFAISGDVDGVAYDLDESMVPDFGQWIWPKEPPLTPPAPKPKKHVVKKAVKKTVTAAKHTVKHEPVVTAAGAAGSLSAAVAFLSAHLGLHLTTTEMHYVLTALPGLATLFAAVRTRPVALTAIPGALATIAVAALAFGLHWPARYIGTDTALVAAGLAVVLRQAVSPVLVADVEQVADKVGALLHPASAPPAAPPVAVSVAVPAAAAGAAG